jgi:hypothetical protein
MTRRAGSIGGRSLKKSPLFPQVNLLEQCSASFYKNSRLRGQGKEETSPKGETTTMGDAKSPIY